MKPYTQFKKLPKKSREKVVKAISRKAPELVLALVASERRRLTLRRSGIQNAIQATLKDGVKIPLPDSTAATIFRLDNPDLTVDHRALYEDGVEHLGDGITRFHGSAIPESDYRKHYVVRFEDSHYAVDVICRSGDTITKLVKLLKRNDRHMVYGLPFFVYEGKLYHPMTREGDLIAQAVLNNRSPQIEALISEPKQTT